MYRSDSDESIRRYRLDQFSSQQYLFPRPHSTLSLNQLPFNRRRSNPDIYPGARRFSTSYSDEDILSNDQLDQIHFDPRYRDYRSASTINNSNYRVRSNSLHSMSSAGRVTPQYQYQYQPYRRVSSVSPPLHQLTVPLAPQPRRWNTNPSIFIEEYRDDDIQQKSLSDAKVEKKKSLDSLYNTSNDSLVLHQGLSENDIKSFGDLSEIPFIDDDSNESAPCRFDESATDKEMIMRPCRKTVSFDVIETRSEQPMLNGKNFPSKFPKSNFYPTHKTPQLFHAASSSTTRTHLHQKQHHRAIMDNVRRTRDGYIPRSHSQPPPPPPPRRSHSLLLDYYDEDDHCILVDKLIKIRMEEENETHRLCHKHGSTRKKKEDDDERNKINYKEKWSDNDCKATNYNHHHSDEKKSGGDDASELFTGGKVKALTSFFNSLPFKREECNCINIHQSTPNLSSLSSSSERGKGGSNKLSCEEMTMVRKQLKELSDFGLGRKSNDLINVEIHTIDCESMRKARSTPNLCWEPREICHDDCKQHEEMLNRLDKIRTKRLEIRHSPDCHFTQPEQHQHHRCHFSRRCDNLLEEDPPIYHHPRAQTSVVKTTIGHSEKHKCRSACFNIRDPVKRKAAKKKVKMRLSSEDDNESLVI